MDHQQHDTAPINDQHSLERRKPSQVVDKRSDCRMEMMDGDNRTNSNHRRRAGGDERNTRYRRPHNRHSRTMYTTTMVALYAIVALLCVPSNTALAQQILCDNLDYVDEVTLEYDYSLEIAPLTEITSIVSNLESVLIQKLLSFMTCRPTDGVVSKFFQSEHGRDLADLEVVGMNASPDDEIVQAAPRCSEDYCEVDVGGSLIVYVSNNADHDMVSYAFRHVISIIMKENSVLADVPGLLGMSYANPPLCNPTNCGSSGQLEADTANSQENYVSNGLTNMEVIVIATIVSAVVGLIGTIIISKRVLTKKGDNCFAPCDGTGKDRDYLEDPENKAHDDEDDPAESVMSANIQWIVDMNNNLSVIEEDADTEVQSTVTNQTNMTPNKTLRSNDDNSIGSLSTIMVSNRYFPVTSDIR